MIKDYAVGDRVRFDNKQTAWFVRAVIPERDMLLATCTIFGKIYYTIVDFGEDVRGAMNVIGGGLGIFSRHGPDPAIDKAVENLRARIFDQWRWGVSHRNRVPLKITDHTKGAR